MPKTFLYDKPAYGPAFAAEPGWIAEVKAGEFCHSFGGNGWRFKNPGAESPHLLITLDLNDPKLESLRHPSLKSLPLCSHLNSDAWVGEQVFHLHPDSLVELIHCEVARPALAEAPDRFPNPLPAVNLALRELQANERPESEKLFFEACDSFVGGGAFIRVLGPPLFLDRVEIVTCVCGKVMRYVCAVGYESYQSRSLLPDRPFFIGEAALYFHFCKSCLNITVTSQAT